MRHMSPRVLILSADPSAVSGWRLLLEQHGHLPIHAADTTTALQLLAASAPDLVIVDLPETDAGADQIRTIRSNFQQIPLIAVLARGTVELVATAFAAGANDVLASSMDPARMLTAMDDLLARSRMPLCVIPGTRLDTDMVGQTPIMQEVFRDLALAANDDRPALITGPPGSGKSLAAWMLHRHSRGRDQAFRTLDFRAIPPSRIPIDTLIDRTRLDATSNGTLVIDGARQLRSDLLDRITALPGIRIILIADANRHGQVDAAWMDGVRASHVVSLPPLRNRGDDIALIAGHMLQLQADRTGRRLEMSSLALARLSSHPWPGNARELAETIAGAVDAAIAGVIRPEHLDLHERTDPDGGDGWLLGLADTLLDGERHAAFEAWHDRLDGVLFRRALERTRGNQLLAASLLGVHRATLRKRCRELGLSVGRTGDRAG